MLRRLFTFVFICMDAVSRPLSLVFGDGRVEIVRRFILKVTLVVGPIFVLASLGLAISTSVFLHRSLRTEGLVTSLAAKSDAEDGTIVYAPVFSFAAANGASFVITSDVYTHPAGFAVGDRVSVRYRSETPQQARIDEFWQMWFSPIICGAMGLGITLLGAFLAAYEHWLDRRGLTVF